MAKGGGGGGSQNRQTVTQTPWAPAQPYITDVMSQGRTLANQQPTYYPGQTYVGPTDAETQAWQSQANYNNSVFGGQPTAQYGDAVNSLTNSLQGNNDLSRMSAGTSPGAQQTLNQAFSPYDIGGRYDALQGPQGQISNPQAQQGQIGNYQFNTQLNPYANAPQFGKAGDLDATSAYQKMLSGQPDYAGAQGQVDAANADTMRQFNQTVIPQLNQRATFTNNMTGGIKGLNAAVPELQDRMNENALNIYGAERTRALDQQERAANQVSQGGFQGYGLGLQTAQGNAGLQQSQANLNLSADQARANTGLQDNGQQLQAQMAQYGINNDQANFGLQRENAREGALGGYRSDALGYGNLAGNLAAQQAGDQARSVSMFPSVYDAGKTASTDQLAYANYDRAIQEDALNSDVTKFNYMRDQPYNNLSWYGNLVNGSASPYGSQTTTGPAGSKTAGALGGAITGYQATQGMPWWGQLLGTLGGAYAGGYG
jgi:hypothetical protein